MRVLIVGLGSIARKHIAALRNIEPGCEILALRSSRSSKPEDGVHDIYDIRDIAERKIDFAIISTPTAEHMRSINAVKDLRCPLFIEKPIYHTVECKSLVEELTESGILTYVACNLRFLESIIYLKETIEKGEKRINEVNSYCGSYLPEWRKGVDFRKVYSSDPLMGGGVHIDLIHELDYLYWLFGSPEYVSCTLRNNSTLGISAVDYANYCIAYPGFCANVVLNYYRRDYKRTLEVVWEDETWNMDLSENEIRCGGRVVFSSGRTIADTYESQLRYFINLIKTNQSTSFNSVEDAMEVLDICLTK